MQRHLRWRVPLSPFGLIRRRLVCLTASPSDSAVPARHRNVPAKGHRSSPPRCGIRRNTSAPARSVATKALGPLPQPESPVIRPPLRPKRQPDTNAHCLEQTAFSLLLGTHILTDYLRKTPWRLPIYWDVSRKSEKIIEKLDRKSVVVGK